MSVTDIIAGIERETAAKIDRRLAEADATAEAILDQARAGVRARVEDAVVRAEPAIRAATARRTNAARARLQERRDQLTLGRATAVHDAARAQLDAIAAGGDPERWARSLRCLLDEALELVGRQAVVRVRDRDASLIAARVREADASLERLPDDAPAGIVAVSSDGRLEVDATLECRLRRARAGLAESVARQLGLGD
jgi:vacuolar-type H+-ATPase subunit E/Vma4